MCGGKTRQNKLRNFLYAQNYEQQIYKIDLTICLSLNIVNHTHRVNDTVQFLLFFFFHSSVTHVAL